MKKFCIVTSAIVMFSTLAFSQKLTQTVRGTIVDADNQLPLIGATVLIPGSNPIVGTTSDLDGNFRIENIPVGRTSIQLSYMGYETKTIPDIEVNSGKEVVLDLRMQESIIKLDEVVVKPKRNNGEALNEMALISSRSVTLEQTERYAGSFNDPSRIVSNFAGVTNTQDGGNDIIVRGNSPKYVQWRLEGIEITNPNHFEDQNSSSGGISALNNNLLATSDFYTGAFAPEYGDVLSGVYDVKLRTGNNEKFESTFGFGLMGTDLTLEGPFKKGYAGSYIVNYRYSTISLISDLGLIDKEELNGILNYQDAAFKINLPTRKAGTFSIFALGGLDNCEIDDIPLLQTPGENNFRPDIIQDYSNNNYLLNTGIKHVYRFNEKSLVKTTLSFSGTGIDNDVYESQVIETVDDQEDILRDTLDRRINFKSDLKNNVYRGAITYSNKINAKNTIQIGAKYSLLTYDNHQSALKGDVNPARINLTDFNENISTLKNFISWKLRLSQNVTIVSGIHNMNVLYNKKSTIEPRIAVDWKLNNTNSFHIGYGSHSNMERIHNYFTEIKQDDGSVIEPNKDLGLLKAHHFVMGYNNRIGENLMAKVEVYYQYLYNLPVENNDTSYYATINEGLDYRYVDLVNEGIGKNYGIEITLERFLHNNFYYLINASLYDSKYKSLEGIWRNTQYNGNYLVNILFGKEFVKLGKKNNQTFAVNGKFFYGGGKRIIPLLRDDQGNLSVDPANNRYWDYEKAYENKIEDTYQVILTLSYKINRPKATHEIFIDLQNLTNNKGKIFEYYDASKPNSIGYYTRSGFYPNLMYRLYF
jgi:hypothetical protein